MFETIIASFIKRYVTRYIDINADQLSAQLLYKQQIIIENLTLNKTILNEDIRTKFKLPIQIETIHIEKIQCSFAWSSLLFRSSSAAFIIKINGVRAIIKSTTIDENESSDELSSDDSTIYKFNQLNLSEQQLEKEFECFGEVKSSKWNVQKLFMSFFEKLQIEIIDIHINYESIGLTCDSIQMSNEPTDKTLSRQIIRIINPGFYININNPLTHSYVLSPITSMEIYFIHNHFMASQKEYHYEFECSLNNVNMICNYEQVRVLGDITRFIQYSTFRHMLISDPTRPNSKVSKQSVKAWWYYTTLAVLRTQINSKNFWFNRSLLIHRLRQLNIYKRLYRAYLDNKYNKNFEFSVENEEIMNGIEREFDLKHLLIIHRSIFQARINQELSQKKETNRWYSTYAKWITTKLVDLWGKIPASENADTESLNENDKELQEQVNTFIAESLEDEDLLESCQAALIFRFNFSIKSLQLDLLSANNNILFNFGIKNISTMSEFRLRNQSIQASIYLEDLYVRHQGQSIISSKERLEQIPVVELLLEKKAKSRSMKPSVYSINLRSCGLCIVCCPETVTRLHEFYASTPSWSSSFTHWKRIKNYTINNSISLLEYIIPVPTLNTKKMKASYLQSIRRNRHKLKRQFIVFVDLGAPKIIIPLSSNETLIVDLGCITLTNSTSDNTVAFDQQQIQENDDNEEFLTPDSSPEADDNPLEEETIYYPVNTIPIDIEYSSFTLSITDIQAEYSINHLQIVEKFNLDFLIQYPLNHIWSLINISGALPKIIIHLKPQIIQSLICSIKSWITFITKLSPKQYYKSDICPTFIFRLDEINVLLYDNDQSLCNIHIQDIELLLTNKNNSTDITFALQNLTIFDCMNQSEGNHEILLKINQNSNGNNPFIRANMSFLTTSQTPEINTIMDINANKLDFVFNPKTICTLINFVVNTDLLSSSQTTFEHFNMIQYKSNINFQEINVQFISITPITVHLQNVSLNVLFHTLLTVEVAIRGLKINHHPDLIVDLEPQQIDQPALHMLLSIKDANNHNLTIKTTSISYRHSLKTIDSVQEILQCINQNCLDSKRNSLIIWLFNYSIHSKLNIDLDTLIVIFPKDISLKLDHIQMKNQSSNFEININRIDFQSSCSFLEHLSLILNFQITESSLTMNISPLSPLHVYLSQNRFKYLHTILSTIFTQNKSSSFKFAFYLQPSQVMITYQLSSTLCEIILDQSQISYELNHSSTKRFAIQFDSLQIKDRKDCLIASKSTSSIELHIFQIDKYHKQFNIKFRKLDIKFVKSTWLVLSEIIEIVKKQKNQSHSTEILFNIDSMSCLFQDDIILLMNVNLQRFIFQIKTSLNSSKINCQFGSISLNDLSTIDQLYTERFCTNGLNLNFMKQNNHSEINLRMTSIQYIHTQRFLLNFIDYFNRFRKNEDISKYFQPSISNSNQTVFNVDIKNLSLIIPEHILKNPVLIFQLGSIKLNSSQLNMILIEIKDIEFYSAIYNLINERIPTCIRFSNFGFLRNQLSSLVREPFHLKLEIKTFPTYSIKCHLSSMDILFDLNHYRLIQNILINNNLHEHRLNSSITIECSIMIEIDQVGLEIFVLNVDLLSFNHRQSLSYVSLTNLYLFLDHQTVHLLCPKIKLVDTRIQNENLIIPLSRNSNQLEVQLLRTNQQCTITLNSIRFLILIDWLLALNEFLNSVLEQQLFISNPLSIKQIELNLNLNQFEFVLTPTIIDPYSSALIYSSSMTIHYKTFLECFITDFTLLTCQIGNIDETSVSIIEPNDFSLNIHFDKHLCDIQMSILNIRLSYSDIKMINSMFKLIIKQISEAKTRKPLLTFLSHILTSPIRDCHTSFDIRFLNFICNDICICLIDDCFGVNIPLLNINLNPFHLQTIENDRINRTDQCEFTFNISYYNRFQSGFEPLIELCSMQINLSRSASLSTSLFISSREILNLNFTKSMYQLLDTIKTNWKMDQQNSKKTTDFRRVKPLEPYCIKNSLGIQIKFRTWITAEQRFSLTEQIVDDNQTISFYFPTHSGNTSQHSQTRLRSTSLIASLFQSDRRLAISINGWEKLQPISLDRIGTFFRLARPSQSNLLSKPMLIMIDIQMTENSIRLITIRSSIEIRNQLLAPIDIRLQTNLDSPYEFSLESNENRSLPIQICSILEQISIRPANFALDYCDEPINWFEIENNQQSFLRTCSIDGKEAVYYVCLQSKQTYRHGFSIYQLSILPPLTICNLLPCLLYFEIPSYPQKLQLNPYKFHRDHTLNILQGIDILFSTDHCRMIKPLHLPSINELHQIKYLHQRMIFYDNIQRELFVDITIICRIKHRLKISVSVPYILLNKSGIPLIFKDSNSKMESPGQRPEDESIVNQEPLLFSFENSNRNNTCTMRVGNDFHRYQDGRPQWCQRFSLEQSSTHRQLQVRSSRNSSDWNYSISIDIRPGTGDLKKINFIFLSARYMICNQSSYNLLISQRDDKSNYLHISKHATVAYHWPKTDIEQLLCVRVYELVNWSGGFQIDNVDAFHINMRYDNGQCLILRVQIIKRNSTYFVVFMDSDQMPAPFRISNRSDIPIQFYQTDIRDEFPYLRTFIYPQQTIDYAWDESTLKPTLTCSIIDGSKAIYDLLKLGSADDLLYQNYIYLAFEDTVDLVIEYIDNRLSLSKCQDNKRSQLWQMTHTGLLIHVGSPSLNDSTKKKEQPDIFVLDIDDFGINDLNKLTTRFTSLTVRRYDPKRSSTQTWKFLDNGYLCLANTSLCVQVFGELIEDSDLILGPISDFISSKNEPTTHIRPHQRYSGSGTLFARVIADGPTNVLEFNHIKPNDSLKTTNIISPTSMIYHLNLHFPAGVGISLISSAGHESEELLYVFVDNISIEYNDKDNEQSIEASIERLIISNQLLITTKPYFLCATFSEDSIVQSAIRLQVNWQKHKANFTLIHIIHSLHIDINSITIQLDEILLWKLIDFFNIEISSLSSLLFSAVGIGSNSPSERKIDLNVNDYETERILSLLTSTRTTRVYFNRLYLSSIDLNLSVYCVQNKRSLSTHLLSIKRSAPFPLVPFENAQIHLKSYEQTHISNTYDFFLLSLMTHYVNTCKRQALKILGSVDFLGNPLGLIHDVTDGLSCLVEQRSVSGLVKSVAHGVADSTSKVAGSLSHGLGKLVPDDRRQSVPDNHRTSNISHAIRQGTAGIAAGFYGGLTSMIKQPYRGVVEDGVPGLVKGFAKGLVGTVSKPMVGILDFTNGMAVAIKEGSRSSNSILQNRIRPIRCPTNILGLLQPYSFSDAEGHNLLFKINKGDLTERYISRFTLSTSNQPIDAMITTQRVIIYQLNEDCFDILNSFDFNTSMTVVPIEDNNHRAYIQFLLDSKSSKVFTHSCDTIEQATNICRDIQRAQNIFEEEKMIYIPSDDENEDNIDE